MYCELKNQIITGILSSPIIYVPHFHYHLIDEVIMEIISPSLSNRRILDLSEDSILEYSLSEGIIDFVLSIDTVEVAVSIMEVKKNSYKISLRGKSTDVNAIASVYGGGGHVLASGCMINGYLEDVIDKLSYTVSQYMV